MKRSLMSILLLLTLTTSVFAQVNGKKISKKLCNCLEKEVAESDSLKLINCFQKEALPKLLKLTSEEQAEKVFEELDVRLHKDCREFVRIVKTVFPSEHKSDWNLLDENQEPSLTESGCRKFTEHAELYYLEANGDTTRIEIKNGYWKDIFENGQTYSKLTFKWIDACEFKLTFLESNEPSRTRLSKKGDVYKYRILDDMVGYYLMTASYGDVLYEFKIYYR